MWRAIASNFLTLAIVGLMAVAGVIAWGKREYSAEGPLDAAICVRVPSGSNMRALADDLNEQGAVSNASVFRIGASYTDKTQLLKAGAFLVPEGASMEEIVDIVTRGGASTCGTEIVYLIGVNHSDVRVRELDPATSQYEVVAEFDPSEEGVTIPEDYTRVRDQNETRYRISVAEGTTVWQVVNALKGLDFLEGTIEADETPPEGMIAPDSYEVRVGSDVDELLDRMVTAQEARIAEVWANRPEDLEISSPEEMLTLASIIEKETGVAEERRQVASVFANRLDAGMRLQTDPTVIYGVTNGEGVLGRGLRQSELRSDSPYNTYVIEGLPPGPIANPGLASLQAAVEPAETDYLYFVADGTGGHAFAETLAQHNENVARWREIEAQRAGQ